MALSARLASFLCCKDLYIRVMPERMIRPPMVNAMAPLIGCLMPSPSEIETPPSAMTIDDNKTSTSRVKAQLLFISNGGRGST